MFLRRTSHSYGYFSVSSTKIAVFGYTKVKRLCFRFTWPCVYPSLYGDVPPVSTRITSHFWRVLTSFVPPIRNQGVSLAPCQGHALWKIFLPTTGSFFVIYFYCPVFLKAPFGGRLPLIPTFHRFLNAVFLLSFIVAELKHQPFNPSAQPRFQP